MNSADELRELEAENKRLRERLQDLQWIEEDELVAEEESAKKLKTQNTIMVVALVIGIIIFILSNVR